MNQTVPAPKAAALRPVSAATAQVRAGLVGSGPWADMVHAPGLAGHEGVRFTHLWARNPAAARAIADRYGAAVCASHAELLDAVDLVSYCVPPDVQAPLATAAREAGKLVVLEKPAARSAASAVLLEQARGTTGPPAVVNYSRLLDPGVQRWITGHRDTAWTGARVIMTNGAIVSGGPYARSAWRHEADASLWDLGPHALSLLVTLLGPVTGVAASLSAGVVRLRARHRCGGISELLCSVATVNEESYEFTVAGGGRLRLSPGHDKADAFCRAVDVLLHGASGPGDLAASDLRFSTHIVTALEAGARSIADGAPHTVANGMLAADGYLPAAGEP